MGPDWDSERSNESDNVHTDFLNFLELIEELKRPWMPDKVSHEAGRGGVPSGPWARPRAGIQFSNKGPAKG